MTITSVGIGVLMKDPSASKNGISTLWKVRIFGDEITFWSKDNPVEARQNYKEGMRIRGEGRPSWNEFNEDWQLNLNNTAIDLSNVQDTLTMKVDGAIGHELTTDQDDPDEGGGRFMRVEIEAPTRGRDADGNWGDVIVYVRGHVLGEAIDKLLELDRSGVSSYRFTGDLRPSPEWVKNEPGYYMEIYEVEESRGRGSDDDAFWNSKPVGLRKRKSAPVRPNAPVSSSPKRLSPAPAGKPAPVGKSGDPDDPLPF